MVQGLTLLFSSPWCAEVLSRIESSDFSLLAFVNSLVFFGCFSLLNWENGLYMDCYIDLLIFYLWSLKNLSPGISLCWQGCYHSSYNHCFMSGITSVVDLLIILPLFCFFFFYDPKFKYQSDLSMWVYVKLINFLLLTCSSLVIWAWISSTCTLYLIIICFL